MESGAGVSQHIFIGEEYDGATGLSYLNARYYAGNRGQFLSQDPEAKDNPHKFLKDPQQLNYYSYARNNPITLSDPSGRCIGPLLAACAYAVVTAPTWVPAAITAVAGLGAAYATHEVASAAGSYLEGDYNAGDASINRAMMTYGVVAGGVGGMMSVEAQAGRQMTLKEGRSAPQKVVNDQLKQGNAQIAEKIGSGHAYDKHVRGIGNPNGKEYGSLIQSREQFSSYIKGVLDNPSETKSLMNGRTGFWDSRFGSTVIKDPLHRDSGTAFRPQQGKSYFNKLK